MTKSEKELLEGIDKKLEGILRLQAEQNLSEDDSTKQKVKRLHEMGFENSEIAGIIGTSKNNVSTNKSLLRDEGEIDD